MHALVQCIVRKVLVLNIQEYSNNSIPSSLQIKLFWGILLLEIGFVKNNAFKTNPHQVHSFLS